MALEGMKDIKDIVVDTQKYLPDTVIDKLMVMKFEVSRLISKYDRELAIAYISTNFSSNKHLTATALHGMGDTAIIGYLERIAKDIDAEIEKRD